MDAKSVIEKIKEKRLDAALELEAVDPRLRAGAEGRKRAAEVEVRDLEKFYRDHVSENVVIVGVNGSFSSQFGEIAKSRFKIVTVDFLLALDTIYDNVRKRGGRDIYDNHQHWMVLDELNQMKIKYGIVSMPVLQSNFAEFGYEQPLRETLHKVLVKYLGGSLYTLVSRFEIGTQALEKEFGKQILPVVLFNYVTDLDTFILPAPTSVITVNEEVTEDFVKTQLNGIRKTTK